MTGQSLADAEIDQLLATATALPPPTTPVVQPLDPLPVSPVAVIGADGEVSPIAPQVLLPASGQSASAVPQMVLTSYRRAADQLAATEPACKLPWWLLAGIGKVESGHAAGGRVDATGTTRGRIVGPRLDGSTPGTAVVLDTDRGRLDGDSSYDRAVGPMQFLPSTWQQWASDGNRDGRADPHNIFDASLATGRYLCAAGGDLSRDQGQARAILAYNHSNAYLDDVLAWGHAYRDGVQPVPGNTGAISGPAPARASARTATPTLPSPLTTTVAPAPTSSSGAAPTSSTYGTGSTAPPTSGATGTAPAPPTTATPTTATTTPTPHCITTTTAAPTDSTTTASPTPTAGATPCT